MKYFFCIKNNFKVEIRRILYDFICEFIYFAAFRKVKHANFFNGYLL